MSQIKCGAILERLPDSGDVRLLRTMSFEGGNREIFHRRGALRDTDMGAWERRGTSIRSRFHDFTSRIGLLDMLFVRHDDKIVYLPNFRQ